MTSPTAEEIRAELTENEEEPDRDARAARAEQLLTRAGSAGDRALLVEALLGLAAAYDGGCRRRQIFGPFARLLRMWDEEPGDFGPAAARRLHLMFTRIAGCVTAVPDIPLESVWQWQAQMELRYRLAGHSERAVRQSEFTIARGIGDLPGAERAYAAWLAAPRDGMSGCHACELRQQGQWQAHRGDDEEALRLWRPVLEGEHTCACEPGGVLASALLPLVRLGRAGEARGHHLRGYRLLRDAQSAVTRQALADHIAFCALTGNEQRGLEILERHSSHWDPSGDLHGHLVWTGSAARLMRRLTELGQAQRRVAGPSGREWTAAALLEHAADETLALAARFDERNGTSAVSDEVRARMGARPLLERLPLGVRGAPPGDSAPSLRPEESAAAHGTGADGRPGEEPRELLAEARRLSEDGHPSAMDAWQRLEEAVRRTGTALTGVEKAEVLDHRAMRLARTDPAAGAVRFTEAAGIFTDAGDLGQALACRARAALATAFAGQPEQALAQLEPLCREAVSLHSAGRAGTRHATAVLLSRTRVRFLLLDEAGDAQRAAAELDAELAGLIALAGPDRSRPAVLARIADATESRGRLAQMLGDAPGAGEWYAEAARLYHEAGRPWQATGPELLLAQGMLAADRAEEAAELLLRALEDPGRAALRPPEEAADLHIALADAFAAQDRAEEESGHLLEAAHWADAAGDGAGLGAYARLRLGGAGLALGRPGEAAAVLESAMPDLTAGHADGDVVQARWWLGQALCGVGEHAAAAEEFLRAARTASGWEDQRDHAVLAHLAADALKEASLEERAAREYERAGQLWRSLGEIPALVRALRSRAWIAVASTGGGDGAGTGTGSGAPAGAATAEAATEAVELMAAALKELESTLRTVHDSDRRLLTQLELGRTYRQTAELLLRATDGPPDGSGKRPEQDAVNRAAYQEAVTCAERAVTVFRGCGEAGLEERTSAELMAAALELQLGRREAAARRAHSVLEAYPHVRADAATDDGTDTPGGGSGTDGSAEAAADRVAEAASLLARVRE